MFKKCSRFTSPNDLSQQIVPCIRYELMSASTVHVCSCERLAHTHTNTHANEMLTVMSVISLQIPLDSCKIWYKLHTEYVYVIDSNRRNFSFLSTPFFSFQFSDNIDRWPKQIAHILFLVAISVRSGGFLSDIFTVAVIKKWNVFHERVCGKCSQCGNGS